MKPPSFLTTALAAALLCGSAATLIPASQAPALGFSFTNVAREAGLTASTVYGGRDVNTYLLETTGTGVAAIDYDDDGWMDIYPRKRQRRSTAFPRGRSRRITSTGTRATARSRT